MSTDARGGPRRRREGGRRYFPRRKVCFFSAEKIVPNYKEIPILRRFVSEWAKIDSSRKTGTRARYQRMLSVAVKRARYLAMLPYAGSHSQMDLSRPDSYRGRRDRPPMRGGPPPRSGPPREDAPRPAFGAASAPAHSPAAAAQQAPSA